MNNIVKICAIHGELEAHEARIINPNNIRCKYCQRESTRKSREKNRDTLNEKARDRRKNDKDYRDKILKRDREYQNKRYTTQKDHMNAVAKKWRTCNPEKQRDIAYKTRYKISLEKYEELTKEQGNLCKICNEAEIVRSNTTKEIKRLSIDHCHVTGKIRGLLCSKCNCMLGYARDSIKYLQLGLDYLEAFDNDTPSTQLPVRSSGDPA